MDAKFVQLGFIEECKIDGLYSIAHLIPKSKRRHVIYCLEFSDSTYYIGQTNNLVRRYSQHRKTYSDSDVSITKIYYKPVTKSEINEEERLTVYKVEQLGMRQRGIVLPSGVLEGVETDLDEIITPSEQDEWLEDPSRHQDTTYRYTNEQLRLSHREQYEQFRKRRDHLQIEDVIRIYVRQTIPSYRKTEGVFWSLSCMPSTNKNTYPRLACCSINTMETFVIGHELRQPNEIWGFFIVSINGLAVGYDVGTFEELIGIFSQTHPHAELWESGYTAAGQDQIRINFSTIEIAKGLLEDDSILYAAGVLNRNLMRKGATVQWRGHCLQLADQIV